MPPSQLKILSLNCWDLKYVAKERTTRIAAIAKALSSTEHDFINLQEIWVYADYEYIRQSISHKLPYSKFFYSGALGAGLAIFSRFPIVTTSVHPYSLNGEPTDVAAGDWFVGKAAASILVEHPEIGQIQVFNTHLFAKGGEDGPEYLRAHRLVNAWEFSKLVRDAAGLGRFVIAAGDFNSIPTTLPIQIIREQALVSDSWAVAHPDVPPASSSFNITPNDAISIYGVTADSPLNSWSAGKPLDPTARKYQGKRLDYVFYRQPTSHRLPRPQHELRCSDCRVVMSERIPEADMSYSDHFALEATLDILPIVAGGEDDQKEPDIEPSISPSSLSSTISALTACYRFSRHRARRELTIFGLCVTLLVGVTIGSAWIPPSWINPVIVLFTALITWLGTTMLYEGFLFGYWEQNALMNVIEEMEIILSRDPNHQRT